jgi:uncharacterized protein with PQ loop repeat
MLEYIGWFGGILLAICGLPQAVQSVRTKSSNGLAWGFLLLWFFGEFFTFLYILPKNDWPLMLNYSFNLIFVLIIIRYKF